MVTLLNEVHFWSIRDDILIKDTDYGAFRYYEKKEAADFYTESKKTFAEKKGMAWNPPNRRPSRIREKLRELEECLLSHKVVYSSWLENHIYQLMLSSGLIISVFIKVATGDIAKISYDKFLVGKLQSETISDVVFTNSHLLITYNDNQITVIHFGKFLSKHNLAEKLNNLDPRLQVLELAGPNSRRLDRKMCASRIGDRIAVWWRCTKDEVYPWSPVVKDYDRANVHVYGVTGIKMELLSYRHTEFDPIGVKFSRTNQDAVVCVEQKVSRKGDVTVEIATYEMMRSKLQRIAITSIPLQTQVCCHSFCESDEKILFGCIDGSVVLYDNESGSSAFVKAAFIPSLVTWHPDGSIVTVANDRSQVQFFDLSLANIKTQTISEDVSPSSLLDLSPFFRNQQTLLKISWNGKFKQSCSYEKYVHSNGFLLLVYDRGPLVNVRLVGGSGAEEEFSNSGLSPDVMINNYLSMNQVDSAIGLLLNLNWERQGNACLASLQKIMNHLFRQPLTPQREVQLQTALGSFHSPVLPHSRSTMDKFCDQVKDITRRFFHQLVRYQQLEKAFCLAIDVDDHDLFMDLAFCAEKSGDAELVAAAKQKARDIINQTSGRSSEHSTCSNSSCSECELDDQQEEKPPERPPLPNPYKLTMLIPPSATYTPPLPQTHKTPQIQQIQQTLQQQLHIQQHVNQNQRPTLPRAAPLVPPVPRYEPLGFSPFPPKPSVQWKPNIVNSVPLSQHSNRYSQIPMAQPQVHIRPNYALLGAAARPTREIVHTTVSLNIPPPPSITSIASRNAVRNINTLGIPIVSKGAAPTASGGQAKHSGEKNKVKFSDTVTAFIVPQEIPRGEKLKERPHKPNNPFMTDPKKELADSLPLCHPNEDYLKDFARIPAADSSAETEPKSKIKVVHFGIV